jgi:hypothetical protein
MRGLTDRMDFFEAVPDNSLLGQREPNEAYCRAISGKQYAICFTDGGGVELDLSSLDGNFQIEWLDVMNGSWSPATKFDDDRVIPPGQGLYVALIKSRN